jgi:hypothetical protein
MPQVFQESNLRFSFGDQWQVIKYDDHLNHKNIKIELHKAIDFLSVYSNKAVVLYELKSFKNYRIENKGRTANNAEELTTEIAQKVRDTIAGIIGAGRNPNSRDHADWNNICKKIISPAKAVYVIAWVEEDIPEGYFRKKNRVNSQVNLNKLKTKLSWLNSKVSISNISQPPVFEGLEVSRLPIGTKA